MVILFGLVDNSIQTVILWLIDTILLFIIIINTRWFGYRVNIVRAADSIHSIICLKRNEYLNILQFKGVLKLHILQELTYRTGTIHLTKKETRKQTFALGGTRTKPATPKPAAQHVHHFFLFKWVYFILKCAYHIH